MKKEQRPHFESNKRPVTRYALCNELDRLLQSVFQDGSDTKRPKWAFDERLRQSYHPRLTHDDIDVLEEEIIKFLSAFRSYIKEDESFPEISPCKSEYSFHTSLDDPDRVGGFDGDEW